MLDNHRNETHALEDIADVLYDIADPRSVSSLESIMNHEVPGDDDYHFNRKVIYSLGNIGTKQALEAVRKALGSPEHLIKRAAEETLRKAEARAITGEN